MAKDKKNTEQQLGQIEIYTYGSDDLDTDDLEEIIKGPAKITTGKVAAQKLVEYIMSRLS